MGSLRERILSAKDIKSEVFHVAEWGEDVKLVGLTAGQRLRVIKRSTVTEMNADGKSESKQDQALLYPLLIIESAHDPATGEKLFTDGDIDTINARSAGTIEDLAMAVCRLSGMTADAHRVVSKNSAPTPSAATASA
jgi:hypothetical protein